jgi:predicted nucleotidyltransferase
MLYLHKDKIINQLVHKYPKIDKNIIKIILFGSVATKDYRPDSDIDILLISQNRTKTKQIFSDFKMDILLKYNVIINAMYVEEDEYSNTIEPIYKEIKKEGVILWEKRKIQSK